MRSKLRNYVRTFRKRAGFSQDEIAFLLGSQGGAHVCRYERFTRQPTLATALALEAIFQVPVRELFAGVYRKAARQVGARAGLLVKRAGLPSHRPNPTKIKRLQALQEAIKTQ